jgi:hypothetical protein
MRTRNQNHTQNHKVGWDTNTQLEQKKTKNTCKTPNTTKQKHQQKGNNKSIKEAHAIPPRTHLKWTMNQTYSTKNL